MNLSSIPCNHLEATCVTSTSPRKFEPNPMTRSSHEPKSFRYL